jgi:hypothetical protein
MLAVCAFAHVAAEEVRWRDQFLLIERAKTTDPGTGIERLGEDLKSVGAAPDSEVAKFLRAESFEKWKVFEDEHLRFSYPDFPGMKVEVISRGEAKRVPVYGAPVRTAAYSFAYVYRVAVGEITWALLFLQKTEHLDRNICLCGAVVLEALLPHDGCLYAYSLLEAGELKTMQALGDGWRVQLFEWTHSPLTPAMYLALAESVVLKHPLARSEQEWRDFIQREENLRSDVQFGWLRRGMKVDEVIAVLGKPTRQSKRELIYEEVNNEFLSKRTIRVPLNESAFRGFSGDCWKYEDIPPERGTFQWAQKLTESLGETPLKKRSKAFQRDARLALDSFLQEAPNAKDGRRDQWFAVVASLAKIGLRDARVLPLARQCLLDSSATAHHAEWVLKEYQAPDRVELYQSRIRLTLDGAAETLDKKYLSFTPLGDLHNLLVFLGSAEGRAPFVREALRHPHPSIRADAALFLDSLPTAEARPAALHGLEDESERVRQWSARALAQKLATAEDTEVLEAKLREEKNQEVREALTAALARSKR